MKIVKGYKHEVASHCESGSIRNLLKHAGVDVSEAMVFGIGSGIDFIYLSFLKVVSAFPLIVVRAPMGSMYKNMQKLCGIKFHYKKYKTPESALAVADKMIENDKPIALCVDMFYMKYLPAFLQIHIPFHFIILYGKDNDLYTISDPYFQGKGQLTAQGLKPAMLTHAMFNNDNLLAYVEKVPSEINWKYAVIKSLKRTAHKMNLPKFMNLINILGTEGIKLFAKKVNNWPKEYQGYALRDGIIMTATGFEEQGTGGGAFRLIYGAFLQESAKLFNSSDLKDLADQMIENGLEWRECSRDLIKIAKAIPRFNREYPDWFAKNKNEFLESIQDMSNRFLKRAEFEKKFFDDLLLVADNLKE